MLKRMKLSLFALIAAGLMFVVATFAWLAVSGAIDFGENPITIVDIDAITDFDISFDGNSYSPATGISLFNQVPGETMFYRISLANTGDIDILARISLQFFLTSPANALSNTANYAAGRSLVDVYIVNASNSADAQTIVSQSMATLIGELPVGFTYADATMLLFDGLSIPIGQEIFIYFSVTLPEDVNNDYQNLAMSVGDILIEGMGE